MAAHSYVSGEVCIMALSGGWYVAWDGAGRARFFSPSEVEYITI